MSDTLPCNHCTRMVDIRNDAGRMVSGDFYCANCLLEHGDDIREPDKEPPRSHYRCPSCDNDTNIGRMTFAHYDIFDPVTRKWERKPAPEPLHECLSCEYASNDADEWEYPAPLETT